MIQILLNGQDLWVALADTPSERSQGLMGVRNLGALEGMIFSFPEPRQLSFWMKNTLIPLRIGYFDEQGELLNTHEMTPCLPDTSCTTYPSSGVARWALEIPSPTPLIQPGDRLVVNS